MIINVNTITNAQRGVKLLKRYGISAKIGRIKKRIKENGCGYTVNVSTGDYNMIENLFKSSGIEIIGVDDK